MDLDITCLALVSFVTNGYDGYDGYDVMFDKSNCTIIEKSDKSIVFTGKRRNNVYKIDFSELADQKVVCLLSVNDKKWLEAYQTLIIIQMHSVMHA